MPAVDGSLKASARQSDLISLGVRVTGDATVADIVQAIDDKEVCESF